MSESETDRESWPQWSTTPPANASSADRWRQDRGDARMNGTRDKGRLLCAVAAGGAVMLTVAGAGERVAPGWNLGWVLTGLLLCVGAVLWAWSDPADVEEKQDRKGGAYTPTPDYRVHHVHRHQWIHQPYGHVCTTCGWIRVP